MVFVAYQCKCEVTQITAGDEHIYFCDKEQHYNYRQKFHCNITITEELSKKKLKFASIYHTPTVLNCIQCHMKQIIPKIFDFQLLATVNFSDAQIKSLLPGDIHGDRLRTINLQNNFIEKLGEAEIFGKAPKLIHIELAHNLIKSIHVKAFAGLNQLEHLQLSFNRIETLNPMTFISLTKLQILELQNNAIRTIQLGVFQKNLQLHTLLLKNNLIESIADNAFDNLKKLHFFDASNNMILSGHDEVSVSSKIVNLSKMNISDCSVDEAVHTFDATNNHLATVNLSVAIHLVQLNISKNRLTYFEFSNQPDLQEIDLSANWLEAISFEDVPTLLHLNLSHNNLTNLQNLTHLRTLRQLDVSFNRIEAIGLFVFADMNALEILTLRNIGLKYLQYGTFSYQHNLYRLDISYNDFSHLDLRVFYSINSLQEFYVNGNNLSSLNVQEIRAHFPRLERIGISDNLWRCNDLTEIIQLLFAKNIAISVSAPHKNRQNVKGIACEHEPGVENALDKDSKMDPITMLHVVNSKDYVNKSENIDQKLNKLKQYFDERLNKFDLTIQSLNATMAQDRAFFMENIHITNNIFNERINEKYEMSMEKIQNLTKRMNMLVLLMAMDHKDINLEDLENSSDKNLIN